MARLRVDERVGPAELLSRPPSLNLAAIGTTARRWGRPFVFERVVVADRSAAMLGYNYARYQRTAGPPNALPGNMNWWQPIRNNVVEFAGLSGEVGGGTTSTPVITYISRQEWGRRMLRPQDHDRLVAALERLRDEHGYEVNIVTAEKMSRVEQIRLAARTTVRSPVLSYNA